MRKADIQAGPVHGKRHFRKLFRNFAAASLALSWLLGHPAGAQVGATFDLLEVKGVVYRSVKVVAVSSSTVTIRHSDGIAQLALRSLGPELQQRFGYSQAAEDLRELLLSTERKQQAAAQASLPRTVASPRPAARSDSAVGRALARFGTQAKLGEVDLRPRFRELELGTKSQGQRPSCAVFAVVSALEFQNAAAVGHAEKLSEEYLIWATRRTLGIPAGEARKVRLGPGEDDERDAGFVLDEVLSAVRAYGIPLQSELPNRFGLAMENIPDPDSEVIASARSRREVSTYMVPGVNNDVKIANIMHALNEGVPVVIGLGWPHWRSLRAPTLSEQAPMEGYSHAVTLVGYYSKTGQAADVHFIFKNSWGVRWGTGGYGFAEIGYLRRNLFEAVVIEVRSTGG
ncbi:MAG: C1 family peptidase [Opitutaceae bacterium]|nr:C1 family peptidase [Opitutaceae bacterium]